MSLKKNDWIFLDHDFCHLCRGGRIQTSGHSDLGIFNNLWASSIFTRVLADTASAACPSQPGNLEMISMILTAVIWDAEDLCSMNTAKDPESSFTTSPRSTARPLYFLCCVSNLAFFKWQMSINEAKMIFCAFVLLHQSLQICFWLLFCPTPESFKVSHILFPLLLLLRVSSLLEAQE